MSIVGNKKTLKIPKEVPSNIIIKPDSKGGQRGGLGDQAGTFNFASSSHNNNQNRNRDLANPNYGRDFHPSSDMRSNIHHMNPKLKDEAKQKFFDVDYE